jgi:hypothetical protein
MEELYHESPSDSRDSRKAAARRVGDAPALAPPRFAAGLKIAASHSPQATSRRSTKRPTFNP